MASLISLINAAFWVVEAIVIAGVILSWIHALMPRPPAWAYSRPALWLDDVSRAILRPFRQMLQRAGVNTGPLDLSPLIALVVLSLLQRVVIGILISVAV